MGLQHRLQGVGDLLAQPLLHGEALGEEAHQPGELGQADDVLVRDVADVGAAENRQGMVLAQAEELDRAFDQLADPAVRAAPALGGEDGEQLRVAVVAGRAIEQGLDEAPRGVARRRGVEVEPEGGQHLGDVAFISLELLVGELPPLHL